LRPQHNPEQPTVLLRATDAHAGIRHERRASRGQQGAELPGWGRASAAGGGRHAEHFDDLGQIEGGGVELLCGFQIQPVEHVVVVLVTWFRDRGLDVGVAPGPSAVFWWAGSLAAGAGRQVHARGGVESFLEDDVVLPAVAEGVRVADAVALLLEELPDLSISLVAESQFGSGTP
jgi:hypothetical protein